MAKIVVWRYHIGMQFTGQEIAMLRITLKRITFLEHLKLNEMDEMIGALDKRAFHQGEVIIKQGSTGETFYILASGKLGVYKERFFLKTKIANLESNAIFGEMALIDNVKRNATVLGEEDGEIYFMPRDVFKKVLLNNPGIGALIRKTADYRRAQNKAIDLDRGQPTT